ncbi:MAG TPA: NUDIX hydrolase [Steroidobacteraceae bacterium]|jgi:ADP-ribose pyrophosphatase YjhB (NUDIX family)|nr:NUDIX hydrolase [Steroidobacteraceae bacterium]
MKFCSICASPVVIETPPGDHLPRHVCPACGVIHYQNPRIITGCIPEWEDKILICRRAIEPRHGYWTLPAGFMENGETVEHGAAREAHEEALAHVNIGSLIAVVNVLRSQQVHMMFRAELANLDFGAGSESLEVKLVHPRDIPWADLAFESVRFTLERYIEDKAKGEERLHFHTIE